MVPSNPPNLHGHGRRYTFVCVCTGSTKSYDLWKSYKFQPAHKSNNNKGEMWESAANGPTDKRIKSVKLTQKVKATGDFTFPGELFAQVFLCMEKNWKCKEEGSKM